jgi:DNA-binding transcriptional ArsR family regulator
MTTAALAKLEANAPNIARMLTVFANEQRVRILCRLAASKDELCIAALAEAAQMAIGTQKIMKIRRR